MIVDQKVGESHKNSKESKYCGLKKKVERKHKNTKDNGSEIRLIEDDKKMKARHT